MMSMRLFLVTVLVLSFNHVESSTRKDSLKLPSLTSWRHRPVFMRPGTAMEVSGIDIDEPLPIGVPFDFETPLFKGKLLVRLKDCKSDDKASHDEYFRNRRNAMQTVIQGQFKRPLRMDHVFVGSVFKKPMRLTPPKFLAGLMNRVFAGAEIDFCSSRPRVLALLTGSAKTMSIDPPGSEPDIQSAQLPENVSRRFGGLFKSINDRRKTLAAPHTAKHYQFDTENVYTMEIYDECLDYGNCNIRLPVGNFDLGRALGRQAMCLSAVTKNDEVLFDLDIWHENALQPRVSD